MLKINSSKVDWAFAGLLLLALSGCGGRSADSEPQRRVGARADAGGPASDQSDAGATRDDDPTDDATDDVETDDVADDPTSDDDPGSMTPSSMGSATPPEATIDPVTGLPVDPTTGSPVDPSTGLPVPPAMSTPGVAVPAMGGVGTSGPIPIPAPAAPTEPPMVIQDGECYEYQSSGTTNCSIQYECPDRFRFSECQLVGERWSCTCANERNYVTYDLTGVDGSTACETMTNLCELDSGDLEFDGAAECNRAMDGDAYSCQVRERCGQSADVGNGVTAWQVQSEDFAYCYEYDSGSASCDCQSGDVYRNLLLSGASFPDACKYAFDSCAAGEDTQFGGTEQCADPYTSESTSSCSFNQECTRSGDLGGGVSAELRYYRSASCQDSGDAWTCQCDRGGPSVSFSIPPAAAPGQTCTSAVDLCSSVPEIDPDAPLSCEFYGRRSSSQSCNQTNACGTTVAVDGVDVTVFGYLDANCYSDGNGTWVCECYSGGNYDSFEVSTNDAARDVCSAAVTQCEQLIDVELGGSGGVAIGRPLPDIGMAAPVPADR